MTAVQQDEFQPSRLMRENAPILAAALALAFVGFTAWFWFTQENDVLVLLPLGLAVVFFCVDMVLLRKRLRKKSKEIY